LEPLAIERTVYCLACGYAGTLDLYARVKGVLTVFDWKSGKAQHGCRVNREARSSVSGRLGTRLNGAYQPDRSH